MKFHQDEDFKNIDFSDKKEIAEYEHCNFYNCKFNSKNLSGFNFTECKFFMCNFSSANLNNTSLNDVYFEECKLLGLRFDLCNPFLFKVNFKKSQLDFSSFFQCKLKKTSFINVKAARFSKENLSGLLLHFKLIIE